MVQFYPLPLKENINFKVLSFEIRTSSNYDNCTKKASDCMNGKEMKKIRLYMIHLCVLTFDFETLPMFYLNVFNEYTVHLLVIV